MEADNLILLVFSKPEIWDQNSPYYSSKDMKSQAWKYIGETLDVTALTAELCWTCLQNLFCRELKKFLRMVKMTGDPEAYVPKWMYFKSMIFLKEQMVKDDKDLELLSLVFDDSLPRQFPQTSTEEEDCAELDEDYSDRYTLSSDILDNVDAEVDEDYSDGYAPASDILDNVDMSMVSPTSSRKRDIDSDSNYYEHTPKLNKRQRRQEGQGYMDANVSYANATESYVDGTGRCDANLASNGHTNEMDEDYHFVMSILGSVRRIRSDRKTSFKVKVLQLIMEEEASPIENVDPTDA